MRLNAFFEVVKKAEAMSADNQISPTLIEKKGEGQGRTSRRTGGMEKRYKGQRLCLSGKLF